MSQQQSLNNHYGLLDGKLLWKENNLLNYHMFKTDVASLLIILEKVHAFYEFWL